MARVHFRSILIIIITLICIVAVFLRDPIPQDQAYHHFADTRTILSIDNFWNVISNLPFLLLGIIGLLRSDVFKKPLEGTSIAYAFLCIGVAGIGLGSAYYHYAPSNASFVWDRIPMTITFMSFFSIVISRYINYRAGIILLLPLLLAGVISVFFWYWTELKGAGDLRLYALVQFYPMIIIPLIIFIYPTTRVVKIELLGLILLYVVAKVFERQDMTVYQTGKIISGHSLKHIFAAGSIVLMLRMNKEIKNISY